MQEEKLEIKDFLKGYLKYKAEPLDWQKVIEFNFISHNVPGRQEKYDYALKIANKILDLCNKQHVNTLLKFRRADLDSIQPKDNELYLKCMEKLGTPVQRIRKDKTATRRKKLLSVFQKLLLQMGYKLIKKTVLDEDEEKTYYNIVKKNRKGVY